ncbi:MAG: cytidylate kinase-like family protein [Solobacterium sp.]|nr:cytidylate kinase-like family protein [Solobacterium sp.]
MIITISRELGRRLSEQMQIPCYDKEIIFLIARNIGFDESYVEMMSEKGIQSAYLGTFSSRFAGVDWYNRQSIDIIAEQQKIIKDLASKATVSSSDGQLI